MVQVQIISKILITGNIDIIQNNDLTVEYFSGYENEYNFIMEHYRKFGNVPDIATFLSTFNDLDIIDVRESDRYLLDTIREEHLYTKAVPIIKKAAELLKSDANEASEYLLQAVRTDLKPSYDLGGVDIISQAKLRFDELADKKSNNDKWYFTTGFEELDSAINGIQRQDEFVVLFARTNQGKSWILEKIVSHIWGLGFNVGYISPEMSAISVGYRFDTLYKNFSNRDLMYAKDSLDIESYKKYIDTLQTNTHKFIVATPQDFNRTITVSKLRKFVDQYDLQLLAVDGIKYMTDERKQRGDNLTTSLTNISEDLMELSSELHIPVIVVVQANRGGAIYGTEDGTPELENIRDSDGIAQNASKVISIRHNQDVLEMGVKKQRFGVVGTKLKYSWDINTGTFKYIPTYDDSSSDTPIVNAPQTPRPKQNDKRDVF